jgi:hypothetical protein
MAAQAGFAAQRGLQPARQPRALGANVFLFPGQDGSYPMGAGDYLEQAISSTPTDQQVAEFFRRMARWWFEIMRNALVCAALFTFAYRTKDTTLFLLAGLSACAFISFLMTYVNAYTINLFPGVRSNRLQRIGFVVGTGLLMAIPTILLINSMTHFLLAVLPPKP